MVEGMYIGDTFYFIEWRKIYIDGIPTHYEVSENGMVRNTDDGYILSHDIDKDGYHKVTIGVSGKSKHFGVHRLVALMFIPNPDHKPIPHHKDNNPDNNDVSNLEWATYAENRRYAVEASNVIGKRGENSHLNKYKEKDIRLICELFEKGLSNIEISKIVNMPRKYITDIRKGRRWKYISKEYKFDPKSSHRESGYYEELENAILYQLSMNKSVLEITKELNLPNTKIYKSLIKRIKRTSLNDYLLVESSA